MSRDCECRRPDCVTTATRLVDLAVRGGLSAGCGALNSYCVKISGCGSAASATPRTVRSDEIVTHRFPLDRRVTLESPLSSGYTLIPNDRITFLPSAGRDSRQRPLGALRGNELSFRIEVDATDLPSAVYRGTARVQSIDGATDESVVVYLEL